METRICNICNCEKFLSEQFFRKSIFTRKNGTQGISFMKKCLVCHNKWQIDNYLYNKIPNENNYKTCKYCGLSLENNKFETTFMCSSCFKIKKFEQDKQYRIKNKIDKSYKDKQYRIKNKIDLSEKKKIYYINNKSKFIERNLRNEKIRCKVDPMFRLKKTISSCIKKAINKNGKSISKYLQYSIYELKIHLESLFEPWMTWDNHGVYKISLWDDNDQSTWKWNIDHIVPHSTFKYTSMEDQEFKNCWALSNLRPYSAKQNIIDGDRK